MFNQLHQRLQKATLHLHLSDDVYEWRSEKPSHLHSSDDVYERHSEQFNPSNVCEGRSIQLNICLDVQSTSSASAESDPQFNSNHTSILWRKALKQRLDVLPIKPILMCCQQDKQFIRKRRTFANFLKDMRTQQHQQERIHLQRLQKTFTKIHSLTGDNSSSTSTRDVQRTFQSFETIIHLSGRHIHIFNKSTNVRSNNIS